MTLGRKARMGWLVSGIMLVAGTLSAHAPPAVAEPATSYTNTLESPSALLGHWYIYYEDYFYQYQSCVNWGNWAKNGGVNGIIDLVCVKYGGDLKWSNEVYDTNA